jgi:hypothetical protein
MGDILIRTATWPTTFPRHHGFALCLHRRREAGDAETVTLDVQIDSPPVQTTSPTTSSLDLVISQQQQSISENIQESVEGVTSIVPMDNGRPAGTQSYSNWPLAGNMARFPVLLY